MAPTLVDLGRALGVPARAAMVGALLDGAPHPAGELAGVAGVSSATASEHLRVLLETGLVRVETAGRKRNYTLAGARIAAALEALCDGPPAPPATSLRLSR